MKKIYLIIGLFCIIGCDSVPCSQKTLEKWEDVLYFSNGYNLKAQEFSYKGHDYIWFHGNGGHDGHDGFVHNPNCKCNAN